MYSRMSIPQTQKSLWHNVHHKQAERSNSAQVATNDVAWVKRVEFGKGARGAILEVQMRALQLYMIHMISYGV